jgi:hypothetical protein
MSAMTIAVAVAVDTIARFELPLLAGIIGYCPVGACVSLQALCVPKQAKGFPKEKIRRSTHAQARPTVLPNRSNFSNSVVQAATLSLAIGCTTGKTSLARKISGKGCPVHSYVELSDLLFKFRKVHRQ